MAEEYIKRSDALNEINDHCVMAPAWNKLLALTALNQIPAADVAPVALVKPEEIGIDKAYCDWFKCPACGYTMNAEVLDFNGAKFCGGCGAKFDLEGMTE